MDPKDTIRKLSEMTDEAEFERLATAILREVNAGIFVPAPSGSESGG